jgi:hypothetical protein
VDFASTPKRQVPRSSTPKRLNQKNNQPAKASAINSGKKCSRVEPFSSTVLSNIADELLGLKQQVKTIPPPLLSSSVNQSGLTRPIKAHKRKLDMSVIDFNKIKYTARKKGSSTSKKCKMCERNEKQVLACPSNKRKKCQSTEVDNIWSRSGANGARKRLRYDPTSCQDLKWKSLKYPVKFFPNMKSQDIDRLNRAEDCVLSSYECHLKPVLKSSYSYGDYNVWIL